jgi:hypothetical protein
MLPRLLVLKTDLVNPDVYVCAVAGRNSGRSDLDRNPVMASFELNRCSGRSKVRNGSAFKLAVYYLGIPAANHAPFPMTRMRSTGLAQVFGGAGESLSLMRKSPFTSS